MISTNYPNLQLITASTLTTFGIAAISSSGTLASVVQGVFVSGALNPPKINGAPIYTSLSKKAQVAGYATAVVSYMLAQKTTETNPLKFFSGSLLAAGVALSANLITDFFFSYLDQSYPNPPSPDTTRKQNAQETRSDLLNEEAEKADQTPPQPQHDSSNVYTNAVPDLKGLVS